MAYRNRTIPDSDPQLRAFVYSFSRTVAKDPARYGLTPEDAALLVHEADLFINASILATRPGTRTKPTIRAKNDARVRVLGVFRQAINIIRADVSIGWDRRKELGIVTEQRARLSATPAPIVPPTLKIKSAATGGHTIRYSETQHQTRRGKPKRATHLVLLCHIGDRAVMDPKAARYRGAYSRQPIRIEFEPDEVGRVATYFGAWLMPSGEQSPWSLPVTMIIGGSGLPRESAPSSARTITRAA